jgi:hypothetical protein
MARLSVVHRLHGMALAASLLVGLVLPSRVLEAQAVRRGDRITVRAGTALRSTPGGEVIGVSSRPITGAAELVQSTFVRLTIDGFLPVNEVRLTGDRTRGEVGGASGATLRATASANGAAVAELRRSAYVFPMRAGGTFPTGRTVTFLPVRRSLWVDVSRIDGPRGTTAAAAPARERPPTAPSPTSTAAATPPRDTATSAPAPVPPQTVAGPTLETVAPASLRTGPGGEVLASIPGGVPVTSLARENGWVRVRVEGWLPDSSLGAAGARSAGALTAADLRANPMGTVGRLVRWSVEALAFQTADALRQGLAPGERYLLARGPGTERAVLYLAVPDSLAAVAQALPPLAEISITARVRAGRSQPAGVPILDLLELTRR